MLQDTAISGGSKIRNQVFQLTSSRAFSTILQISIVSVYCRLSLTSHVADWYP